jgi:hypothetical protein
LDAVRFLAIAGGEAEIRRRHERFFLDGSHRSATAVASPWQIKLGGPLPDILISCGTAFSEFIWINGLVADWRLEPP